MEKEGIVKRIEKLAIPLLASESLELVDIEFKKESHGLVLRFFIDREGGVDLDTCSRANEALGNLLDTEDLISSSYILEVSSPGIERPLKKQEDFKKFVGSKIYVKTRYKIEGRKHFTGILKSASEETFTIECEGLTIEIPYSEVSKAHLVVDIDF
jgi:ribosome maturation factor RimP